METTQDQQKVILPLNRDTEKLYYNTRIIVDAPVLTQPRTWRVTKVNRIQNRGLAMITMAQTQFNPETDYIELDENGNVIGMYADYWNKGVEPTTKEDQPFNIYSKITYSGKDPVMKIKGSFKKFTVQFFDEIGPIDHKYGIWKFEVDGDNVSHLVEIDGDLSANQIKAKFIGPDDYLGKDLVVSYRSDTGTISSVKMNIQGL